MTTSSPRLEGLKSHPMYRHALRKFLLLRPDNIKSSLRPFLSAFRKFSSSSPSKQGHSSSSSDSYPLLDVKYMVPAQLREHLDKDPSRALRVGLVDCRDEVMDSGKLPGAHHAPANQWWKDEMVDRLVSKLKDKDLVVFYCAHKESERQPWSFHCAKRFLARLNIRLILDGQEGCGPEIHVLRGGLSTWSALYGDSGKQLLIAPVSA